MYKEEIELLLHDIPELDTALWSDKEPDVIGFLVEGSNVTPLMNGTEDSTGLQVRNGFLALGSSTATAEPAPDCSIGLSLAHGFPRSVAGELAAVVRRKAKRGLWLLSVNHVVWMNGWAQAGIPIVKKPYSNPRFTTIGTVASTGENMPLRGRPHVNTFEELALAKYSIKPPGPPEGCSHWPVECDSSQPIYRLDCNGCLRKAHILGMDFRFAQRFEYGRFLFRSQLLIEGESLGHRKDPCGKLEEVPFASRGDSGSLLYQERQGRYSPVAVLWAGSPDRRPKLDYYIATPLGPYFKRMKLEFVYYETPDKQSLASRTAHYEVKPVAKS